MRIYASYWNCIFLTAKHYSKETFHCMMGTYSTLSALMSKHREVLVIQTFSKLQIKNPLYYQAELAELEQELEEAENADLACSQAPRRDFSHHWKSLSSTVSPVEVVGGRASSQDARARQQWKFVLRVRDSLKEYGK
jgi:hypothetical protein